MYLRQLFRILFRTLNHQYDYTFDWTMLKQKQAHPSQVPSGGNVVVSSATHGAVPRSSHPPTAKDTSKGKR